MPVVYEHFLAIIYRRHITNDYLFVGLWWALAATMFVNAWVYQFFLARTDWDAEAIKAWQRVFHKESISIGPDKSEFNEHLIEHNEKTGKVFVGLNLFNLNVEASVQNTEKLSYNNSNNC